ncbi:putative WD-repeat protein [Aspergillus fijiensis CBS 313.89]|uniref:Mitochondrial division protein 1 n=1 Tax=Aspergillus fijiensis CBS 313.89 TaxID=1448319 RepID=A0A8G1RP60_9EURO|nr:putative WD-repeat protein [Aspergillus fijiensis CBS 313.89]RAK75400.1 putative WD-repeat protein [Aspergillus fijiensis CBS 313.89]
MTFHVLLSEVYVTTQTRQKTKPGKTMRQLWPLHMQRNFWDAFSLVLLIPRCQQELYWKRTQEAQDTLSIIQSQFNQTIGWQNLRVVQDALFDSHGNQHEECLPGTRTNLLNEVETWVESIDGKCIFWLNGIAGTGKSTIAQTLARNLDKKGELGASFFFKKGEADRATARYLISTIIGQLVKHYPKLAPGVLKAVKEKPDISFKSLQQQFNDLLLSPLLTLHSAKPTTVVVVIDALDECDQEDDIKLIIRLLPALQQSQAVRPRIFLTSRSELLIRLGFKENEHHQDLILYKLPEPVTEHDIRLFLKYEFTQIWRHPSSLQCSLSPVSPGDDNFEKLVTMAVPLFIIAATICCFLEDGYKLPDERLRSVLEDRAMISRSDMQMICQKILDRHHASRSQNKLIEILQDSYSIIGIIILLATPLSVRAAARLKEIPDTKIISQLQRFHSTLDTSANLEAPVQILRLSFEDHLLKTTEKRLFIDNQEIHGEIASYCLRLMKAKLKENICELESYGIQYKNIRLQIIKKYLTLDIQYACFFWLRHLKQSKDKISNSDILSFLQEHLLHWLEVLALIGEISEALGLINILNSRVHSSSELAGFLYDAERFIRQNSYIAGIAPLQLYRAGLVFAPTKSVIKKIFYDKNMHQLIDLTAVEDSWSSNLQTLEGHSKVVGSVAFSPNGCILATGSTDHTIKLWDTATGIEKRMLSGHSNWVFSVAFSPDSYILATGSRDHTIKLWNTTTDTEQYTLAGHSGPVYSIAFLPDSCILATGSSDCTIKLWDTAKRVELDTLTGHSGPVYSVACSPDGCLLATGSSDRTIKLWDTSKRVELYTLTGHSGLVRSVAFSPDGCILASGSSDCTIKLWRIAQGVEHSGPVRSAVATGSYNRTIKLSNLAAGFKQHTLTGHSSQVLSVAFSPDGCMLATGSRDFTVKLWKTATGVEQYTLTGHSGPIRSLAFSPLLHSHLLVTGSDDQTTKLWDIARGVKQCKLNSHSGPVLSMAFSPNGRILATGSSDYTIKLWNTATGTEIYTLTGHSGRVSLVVFSPDSCVLATGSHDHNVKVWDTTTGIIRYTLSYSSLVRSIAFSPDGYILVTKSSDHQTIKLWDAATGVEQHTQTGHSRLLSSILNKPRFNSHLSIEDSWISLRGERVLWLTAEYRSFTSYAVKDNTVALGFRNGRCHVLHFNFL